MNIQQDLIGPTAGLVAGVALLLLCIFVSQFYIKLDHKPSKKFMYLIMAFVLISISLRTVQLILPDS